MKVNNEIKIGLMVVVTIVLLLAMTFKAENLDFSKKGYIIKVQFRDINGISLSSPVMFNGYEMGKVEDIVIQDDAEEIKMVLILRLDEKAHLKEGAKAYVKNLGFMGDKYIGLTSGDKNASYLVPGTVLEGEDPIDVEKLIEDGKEISFQLKEISRNINERLETNKETVDEILAGLNEGLKKVVSITDNIDKRLDVNKKRVDNIVAHLEATTKNLEEMSHDLKLHPWKIMYKGKGKQKKEIESTEGEVYENR